MPIKYFCDLFNNRYVEYIKFSDDILRVSTFWITVQQKQREDLLNDIINVKRNSPYWDISPTD